MLQFSFYVNVWLTKVEKDAEIEILLLIKFIILPIGSIVSDVVGDSPVGDV
jgi:hypothetical protein